MIPGIHLGSVINTPACTPTEGWACTHAKIYIHSHAYHTHEKWKKRGENITSDTAICERLQCCIPLTW